MRPLDRRLRAQRPAKPPIDPWRLLGVQREPERAPDDSIEQTATLFLAGRECPFTCVFCDLWRHTTDEPTPAGAIPEQIRRGLAAARQAGPVDTLKLYNASNFFDDKAVPAADDDAILRRVRDLPRVVVESHAKLLGARCARYAAELTDAGSRLEVAVGFETVHPAALPKLNKQVDVGDLRRAAGRLADLGADLRAFVLIGVPFIAPDDQLPWIRRTVETALELDARLVSLIPMRGGIELARLERRGEWRPPDLDLVEAAFAEGRRLSPARVRLDTWDLDALADADGGDDRKRRVEALARAQLEPGAGLSRPSLAPLSPADAPAPSGATTP